MKIVESLISENYSQEEMIKMAGFWYEPGIAEDPRACHTPQDYVWTYYPKYPVSKFTAMSKEEWQAWMKEEIDMWANEGQSDRYDDLLHDKEIHEPIVAIELDGHAHIWDGHHRIGASNTVDRASVPAIIGRLKEPAIKEDDQSMMVSEPQIDNSMGHGATGNNANVDYRGMRVMMKPSVFLSLAIPLSGEHSAGLEAMIKRGEKIGSPFLLIWIPDGWREGDFSEPYSVVIGHEGRNRCGAIMKLFGDKPIEVHLFAHGDRYEWRNRHMSDEIMDHLNAGMLSEGSHRLLPGPLFQVKK